MDVEFEVSADETGRMIKNRMKFEYDNDIAMSSSWLSSHPDRYGCYAEFVADFGTPELMDDFPLILHEFLKHEFVNIDKYTELSFWSFPRGQVAFQFDVYCQMKNIMVSAYCQGSSFTKNYWRNIFEEYFAEDVDFLKRVKNITFDILNRHVPDTIMSEMDYYCTIAGWLFIAEAFDLAIDNSCSFLYKSLNSYWKDRVEKVLKGIDSPLFSTDVSKYSDEEAKNITEYIEKYPCPTHWDELRKRGYKPLMYAHEISNYVFRQNNFGINYAVVSACNYSPDCVEVSPNVAMHYANMYMKEKHPTVDFSTDELQILGELVYVVNSYACCVTGVGHMIDGLMGYRYIEQRGEDANFYKNHFKKRLVPNDSTIASSVREKLTEPKDDETKYSSDEQSLSEMANEIERLRLELHKVASSYEYLKNLYREKKTYQKQTEQLSDKYAIEHEELIRLREYVFSITDDDISLDLKIDYSEKINELAQLKVIIIGGHPNWTSKLKSLFPQWNFISPRVSDSIDEKVINGCDFVYFYTDFLSHSTYYKYISSIRQRGMQFGYISSVNIEKNLAQFSRELL